MKKLLLLLIAPLLAACQIYSLDSEPTNLTGGKWILTDYDVVVISAISQVDIIKNDTICINSFNKQILSNGQIIMKQIYDNTAKDRRFVVGQTIWEFDNYNNHLYTDFQFGNNHITPNHSPYFVAFPKNYWENEYTRMSINNTENGAITNWTFHTNAITGYPNKLIMTSPNITTDLYSGGGARDKAITVKIVLYFER